MNKLPVFALLLAGLAVVVAPSYGDSIYEIDFTGTITAGSVLDYNLATNTSQMVQDLTGLQISGTVLFDLSTAPPPSVTTSGPFLNTSISTTSGPVFVSESVQIDGLTTAPAGFLPLPTVLNQAPIPPGPPGATLSQTQSDQQLGSSTVANGMGSQSIIGELDFSNIWSGPQGGLSQDTDLNFLIDSVQPFFSVPPTGDFPSNWSILNPGGSGTFLFFQLGINPADPNNFGITSDYEINGSFTLDSATGFLVSTPEPRTLPLVAIGLLMIGAAVVRSRRLA